MSAIQRQTNVSPDILQAQSPLIIPHATFVGLAIQLSDGAAVLTVAVDSLSTGDFDNTVTMEGTTKHRWPDSDGMNRLYNATFVKLTWNTGTLRYTQIG